jgi:hypothetical protein
MAFHGCSEAKFSEELEDGQPEKYQMGHHFPYLMT